MKLFFKNILLKRTTLLLIVFFLLLANIRQVLAWSFDPSNILTDQELKDYQSMSKTAIQKFLEREKSVLAAYSSLVKGTYKTAAEIIFEISNNHKISPKFLLTTLEKEKGLIQKSTATQKDLDWATGYSCYSNKCNDKYKGFYDQLESAAITQNIYFEKAGQFSFKKGVTSQTNDGYAVTPKNQATVNLYIYTPYIGYAPDFGYNNIENGAGKFGANFLFWKIWNRYFTDRKIPNGFAVKNGANYWKIENNKKRKYASPEIFLKDHPDSEAVFASSKILGAYEDGPIIYFANNTLVRSTANNQVFLISNGTKRPIIDLAALAILNDVRMAAATADQIPLVENEKLLSYQPGNPINAQSQYPQGKLFQDETSRAFWVQDGMKFPVHPLVLKINYPDKIPYLTTGSELEKYVTGSPISLRDGAIVKNSKGDFYAISDSEKIKIESADTSVKIFGEPMHQAAISVPDEILQIHKNGYNIAYADESITDPPKAENLAFAPLLQSVHPESLIAPTGGKTSVRIILINSGPAAWEKNAVWIEKENDAQRYEFEETLVPNGKTAGFTIPLQAPNVQGLSPINFTVYKETNGAKEKLLSFGRFMLVQYAQTAKIISHNLPAAAKNNWQPLKITMKIQNTSTSTPWLARKTALEVYGEDGKASPFYDPNDWVRKEVAAVPINKKIIKPGEIGEFSFTLKVKGLKSGAYNLKFKLNLLDKQKEVFLDNSKEWIKTIRVDR